MYKYEKEILEAQMGRETEVLKELQREYAAALKQIEEKIKLLQADELTQSRIYQLQYQHALKAQVEAILEKLHADEYSTIQQYLSDSYSDGFISTMYCFHKQDVPLILPIDKKAAVRAILTDSKIRGSLYESLGINVNAMKKSIRQEINRGIASGLSYADIIRNLKNATKAPLANAKTIVRTEGHRIQQASAEDARMQAKAKGADVVKQWDATMDGDTRPMHQQLDGQIKETNEPFSYGSKKAMYPGDFGDPAEDCNCRCVALTRARWALDEDELKELKARAEYFKLDKTDSFEEFKGKYLKAAEVSEKSESPKVSFKPAKTKEEAEAYAKRFSSSVSYAGVSLDNANQINEQLTILTSKYPINKLEEITLGHKGVMTANYKKLTISRNKLGKTLENAHEVFLQNQEKDKESLKIMREKFAGKKMPFAIEKNVRSLENNLRFKRWGVNESYSNKVQAVVTHEYGHIIADQYLGMINQEKANPHMLTNWSIKNKNDKWKQIYKTSLEKGDIYNISQYGSTSAIEYFAECFAAREFGEKLPDYVEEFMVEVLNNGIL